MGLELDLKSKERAILGVYGEVGLDFTADDFRQALSEIPDGQGIELRIHSPGGDYYEGIAIHTNLARRDVHAVIDGLAASAGSLIAMAGKSIEMAEGSWMMIHEIRGGLRGATADDFRAAAKRIDAGNEEIVGIYSRRFKGTKDQIRKAMKVETWYTAGDAIAAGLADTIGTGVAMAACADLGKFEYANVPELLVKAQPRKIEHPQHVLDGLKRVEGIIGEKLNA